MNKNKKYRIAWHSKVTGAVGYGEPVFWSHVIATHVAKQLDKDWPDKEHWVVPADESVAVVGGEQVTGGDGHTHLVEVPQQLIDGG
jgi:hypothetical protein